MNISGYKTILTLVMIVIETRAKDVVSEEIQGDQMLRKVKNTYSVVGVERRFLETLDDKEWHVAHLRDTDFGARRSGCKEETFEEKAKRYRKSLKRDGALVDYVSSDPLPFNEKDLAVDICNLPEVVERVFRIDKKSSAKDDKEDKVETKEEPIKKQVNTATTISNTTGHNTTGGNTTGHNTTGSNTTGHNTTGSNTTGSNNTGSNTTGSNNTGSNTTGSNTTGSNDGKRRASDYQFSSVEYYDEAEDFDISICPNDVEELILEIEHIRNYDVQCEIILEWRSLESNVYIT